MAAHTLKGSVGVFCASRAFHAALELEEMGHSSALIGAEAAYQELTMAMEHLQPALAQLERGIGGENANCD